MDRDIIANTLGAAAMRLLEQRLVKIVKVPTPTAGSDWIVSVPGGVIWELLAAEGNFVSSAVVGTRFTKLAYDDADAFELLRLPPAVSQAPSISQIYGWAIGYGDHNSVVNAIAALPSPAIPLQPGWKIRSITSNIDAADQWLGVSLVVREWSEADVLQEMRMIAQSMTSQVMPEIYS